jgi:hypothetical protein
MNPGALSSLIFSCNVPADGFDVDARAATAYRLPRKQLADFSGGETYVFIFSGK